MDSTAESIGELSAADHELLGRLGIAAQKANEQVRVLRQPPPPADLVRPCALADGLRHIEPEEEAELDARWRTAAAAGRFTKFVPASGAATRMFRCLREVLGAPALDTLEALAGAEGNDAAEETRRFFEARDRFAFAALLAAEVDRRGTSTGDVHGVLEALLADSGLGYASLPKALVAFHDYASGPRTAFEEHLVEGLGYLGADGAPCRFHFTISPQHSAAFRAVAAEAAERLERSAGARLEITFSSQSRHTDTIALDPDGRPFRTRDGSLLLRPSGHGALLANLGALNADLVFIKNVDNVRPESRHQLIITWKRRLAGLLLRLEEEVHRLLAQLEPGRLDEEAAGLAARFAERELGAALPVTLESAPVEVRADWLRRRLDRPLRVCGMVPRAGDRGGGPFWVRDGGGRVTPQIVEAAQVDSGSARQTAIWESSTHFNPVDVVGALRNRRGQQYDLQSYVDYDTAFVARKTYEGRPLLALERPGLWNGSMAGWNTVFVEVPAETFAPAKTVLHLLDPEHQPDDR